MHFLLGLTAEGDLAGEQSEPISPLTTQWSHQQPMDHRSILHLDLDAFFVAVEQLRNSQLKGKPLIIGGTSGRGVVASCSYEARKFGIHAAMPMKLARQRCPEAIVLRGDMEQYSKYSQLVTEVVAADAPLFEKASIDEFYLDLTGMDKYFGCQQWAGELRERIIRETGLPLSYGLSINKLVAKVATGEGKPNGSLPIPLGNERAFLAPLSTRKLPGLGAKTYQRLYHKGVRQIYTLAQIPPRLLEREFGKNGYTLWRSANAEDDRPVVPQREAQSISQEHTFASDTIAVHTIHDRLTELVVQLGYQLRSTQKLTATITVKIRYADFNTFTKQRRIAYTAQDSELLRHARELYTALYERRQLIRLVGIRLSGLVNGSPQMDLFHTTTREAKLLSTLDKIRNRFGKNAIQRGSCLEVRGQNGRVAPCQTAALSDERRDKKEQQSDNPQGDLTVSALTSDSKAV